MKVAVGVYRVSRHGVWDWIETLKSVRLLHRRKAALARAGISVVSLGEGSAEPEVWAKETEAQGADVLWLCFRSNGRNFRHSLVRDPDRLGGLSLWADGVIGSTLPPTPGQRKVLSALGMCYLDGPEDWKGQLIQLAAMELDCLG